MGSFTATESIFIDDYVLSEEYTPDEMLEREEELSSFNVPLMPAARGSKPANIFVYGNTGAGKTEATRLKLNELQEDTGSINGVNVRQVWQNCQERSAYDVSIELVNSFRDHKNHITTGHAKMTILDELWREIDECEASHVIFVLDEVDSLGTDDYLLYYLSRPNSVMEIDTHISVIGTCNNFQYRDELSARVKSTLCQHEIRFGGYNADELRTILQSRAEDAFYDGVLEDDVVPLAAARAAQDTGSARRALDILHRSGWLAVEDGSDTVTEEHVRTAIDKVERDIIVDELRDMSTQQHTVLCAVAKEIQSGNVPFSSSDVYDRYKAITTRTGVDEKTQRTVKSRLSDLSVTGFLEVHEHNHGEAGGRRFTYELTVDMEYVVDALEDQPRFRDVLGV